MNWIKVVKMPKSDFAKTDSIFEKIYSSLHFHAKRWLSPFNLCLKIASGKSDYSLNGVGPGKTSSDPEGRGGIIGINFQSGVTYRPRFRLACSYKSGFF